MARGMIGTMSVKKGAMTRATDIGFMTATELADVIVRTTGIPFRTAHHIVGAIAKAGTTPTVTILDRLSLEIINEKLSDKGLTEKAVRMALDPMDNVRKRRIQGGPSPLETKRQIAVIKKNMMAVKIEIRRSYEKIKQASNKLSKICKKYT